MWVLTGEDRLVNIDSALEIKVKGAFEQTNDGPQVGRLLGKKLVAVFAEREEALAYVENGGDVDARIDSARDILIAAMHENQRFCQLLDQF